MSGQADEYRTDTVEAYQNVERAIAYDRQHTKDLTWARFTMWREVEAVRRALDEFGVGRGTVLDVPCGTGVAAGAFNTMGSRVTAVDISREMMSLARVRYDDETFHGFLQADITALPFADGAFDAAVTLGFMHRVPEGVKRTALRELARVTKRVLVVSFSVESSSQRLKRALVGRLRPGHKFAPAPWERPRIEELVVSFGFTIRRRLVVAPVLSAETVLILEKADLAESPGHG